jgi:anaerobic ribonucleoside-triphosphate reductase
MIEKRDGRKVQFNRQLIKNAVLKAINNTGNNIDEINKQNIADEVADYVDASKEELSVEDIQDQVIFKLKDLGYVDISKAYSNYRKQRTILRERNSTLMKEIEKKITASNIENQNANVDEHSFGGRKGEADSILMKNIALNHVVSKKSRDNHNNNRIYIHDLDSYVLGMSNCLNPKTGFLTSDGVKTFEDFSDGDPVKVLDKDGFWRDATVHYYGRKIMQHVLLEKAGIKKVVTCTPDHRWFLVGGEVTTNLSVGHTLYSNNGEYWSVIAIEPLPDCYEEAWCIEEPVTHSFTLEDGVVTGNCLSIPFDDLLAKGFNTRQSDIRPARSINTAFQLLAVIFQIQSLQQFGGVSATHLDWTMVPYVRISFKKHLKDGFKYVARGDDEILKVLESDEEIGFDYPGLKENYPKAYQYAYDMTERETYQAAEGMYHNLNY